MDISNYSQYKTEQELLNCGLSAESIERIKDTTVITRDGAQHVVPSSQSFLDESRNASASASETESSEETSIIRSLHRQLQEQNQMFVRFKQFSDSRIGHLERQLESALSNIKDLQGAVNTLQSNRAAQLRQEQTSASHVTSKPEPVVHTNDDSQQEDDTKEYADNSQNFPQAIPQRKPARDKPIDRNGIAPSSINVEKIFYCGNQ